MITLEKCIINQNVVIANLDVTIPKNWGLSPQGNQSLTRKCKSLVRKLEKVTVKNPSPKEYIRIFTLFYNSYQKSLKTVVYQTNDNTQLNTKIMLFLESCIKSSNLDNSLINCIK